MKTEFKITYFLWKARKDKEGLMPVYLRSKQNSEKQISYNTGVKLLSEQWNKNRNEPKNKPASLLELEKKLKDTYRDLVDQGYEPNLTLILEHKADHRKPSDKNVTAWCDDYIKGSYSAGQKKAVGTLKTNIEAFQKSITFDRLTKPRLTAFFNDLTSKGVANNSQYKRLRALVNVANHSGVDYPAITGYKMPYETRNAMKVRLTWAEVKSIVAVGTKSNIEQVAKDCFLLAAFSGLRISDILTLNRGELHQYHYERVQTKTKTPVLISVHGFNADLFKKYIETGVPYTRQRLSAALKLVLERSGLDKSVTRIQQVGHTHKETVQAKFKEISFHSGRRFYSRLLNDLGLGGEIAREELGHGYRSVTELYAGSPDHVYRVSRVRKAMETMEDTLKELSLMKVA